MGIFWKTVRLIYVIKNCRPAEEGGVNVTKEQLGALILILINECYTLLRKSSKLVSLEGMSEMTEIEADEETDYSDLYRAVNSLKEELRLAVILYYIEDNKISVCVGTVRVEDNLQLLGHNNVPKEWSAAVGADGKIVNNTLSYIKSGDGVDTVDEIVKTEKMEQKLVYATVTYTNKTDKEINHMLYLGTLMLMNHENGAYQFEDSTLKSGVVDICQQRKPYCREEAVRSGQPLLHFQRISTIFSNVDINFGFPT